MARVKPADITALEYKKALARGKAEATAGADMARYDPQHDMIVLGMRSGAIALIPRTNIPVVGKTDPENAAELELSPMGTSLRFPKLDADFAVHGLIRRAFDVNQAHRLAGATKSPARAAASRLNGRKGGRPPKKKTAA